MQAKNVKKSGTFSPARGKFARVRNGQKNSCERLRNLANRQNQDFEMSQNHEISEFGLFARFRQDQSAPN